MAVHVHQRNPNETESRRFLAAAEVPLETRPDVSIDGKILISEEIARQAEKAIELLADTLAVTTFSTRKIMSAVPTAGFSSLTEEDREWLAESSGLFQTPSQLDLSPAAIRITQETVSQLDDRRDGVTLLAEAFANTHETGRFRELARFFERAFCAPPAGIVRPLSDFLAYYDKLQYTLQEIDEWRRLRHLATHADQPSRGYVLHRDVRPVLKRVELAAYDVLLNKLNWNAPDSRRRDIWYPSGILPDGHHAVAWVNSSSIKFHAHSLFDGFGAYPYDRSCKVRSHPPDWWLDTTFPVKGQMSLETMGSLRTLSSGDLRPALIYTTAFVRSR